MTINELTSSIRQHQQALMLRLEQLKAEQAETRRVLREIGRHLGRLERDEAGSNGEAS